jgi:Ca-activated chloride channel family protein
VGYLDFASREEDGTAIGDALALAASRMKEEDGSGGVILLLTDGMNNRGMVDPQTAARMCKDLGIRIHAVAIGSQGLVPFPGRGMLGSRMRLSDFDPDSIKRLSETSGGRFYMADSSGVLWEHMKEIDRLEKKEFTRRQYSVFHDGFRWWLYAAAIIFGIEIILRSLVYRKVP